MKTSQLTRNGSHKPDRLAPAPPAPPPAGSKPAHRFSLRRADSPPVGLPIGPDVRRSDARLFRIRSLPGLALLLAAVALVFGSVAPGFAADAKIRVLLVSGGHGFDTNEFYQMFKADPDITFVAVTHPNAYAKLQPDSAKNFDVVVLYDMWQPITEEAKADWLAFLKAGKGLVSMHHSIANYQKWDEWHKVVGGRYYLEKTTVDGVEKPVSIWKHDVDFKVHVADPKHPVTRGVKDFLIHDETYGLFDMAPDSHALLTTDESTSAKNIAWARTYGPARVVYLQLGHDHVAYENPNLRHLVRQAIRWTAKKD
jgi:type 1 glutamine amidotransferase